MGCCCGKNAYAEEEECANPNEVVAAEAPAEEPVETRAAKKTRAAEEPAEEPAKKKSGAAKKKSGAAKKKTRAAKKKSTTGGAPAEIVAFEMPAEETRVLKKAPPGLVIVLGGVQPSVLKLFSKLNDFSKNKQHFRKLMKHLDPTGSLNDLKVTAVGLFDGDAIKIEFYQQGLDGKPVQSTDALYAVAEKALPLYQKMLQDVAKKAGVQVKLADLKGKDRTKQKGDSDYADRECPGGPVTGWVFDIVRGTLLCETAAQIKAAIKYLEDDTRVKMVIKFKNRFKTPTPNGFCDMLLQIVFSDGGITHVCEVQVHLRQITEYAATSKSHESYDYFRVFFDGSMNTVAARLEDMAAIVGKDFAPAPDGTSAVDVMEDIVSDVVASKDIYRMYKMAELCRLYLSELPLAVYIYKKEAEAGIAEYGEEREEVAATYLNMAGALQTQGKLGEAMELYQKCLGIKIKTLGPDHSDVAKSYEGMAIVLDTQGKKGEAMELYQKSLAIRIKTLGPDHSDVAATYNNMALVLDAQGKKGEAMELYQKSLEIRIKTLGPDHSDVAQCYNNMATVLQTQGKLGEAMELYQKSLAIKIKTLGPDHSDVGDTKYNMAMLAKKQGNLDQALELFSESAEISKKALGEDHQYTRDALEEVDRVRNKMA